MEPYSREGRRNKETTDREEEELKELKKKTLEQFWDADLDALSAVLDELDLQDDKDAEAAREAAENRRRKAAGSRGRAPAPQPVKKRTIDRTESKMLSAPLIENAACDLGDVQKSVTGQGDGGPTRFSAADIPLQDQQIVARDPDVLQRPAKAPRTRRAPIAQAKATEEEPQSPDPPPAEDSGGGLLAKLLAGRRSSFSLGSTGSHASLSTGSDFFFGSTGSIFSSGLPKPDADEATPGGGDAGGTEPPSKKVKKGRPKKGAGDDDDNDA